MSEKKRCFAGLRFEDFVEFWPCSCNDEREYDGGIILWDGDTWTLEDGQGCNNEDRPFVKIGYADPFKMFNAIRQIDDWMDTDDINLLIKNAKIKTETYFIYDPKNSNYWSDFDGFFFNDSESDSYVWHEHNGVLTDCDALREWAKELLEEVPE